jgi:NAD(P)-dependent dehydrogenase (short-subunit alcohol dehydrogenase family)
MAAEKIALVTGANRGIGFEIAKELAANGVTVYLAARKLEEAMDAAKQIKGAVPLQLDVTRQDDIDKAVNMIETQHGRLDILVNNAGVNLEADGKATAQTLRDVYEINTIAPYVMVQSFLPLLEKSKAGRIVNQSSFMGSISRFAGENDVGDDWIVPAYSSSKAALNMLTVLQARILKDTKIKINAAHPGWVKTRLGGDTAPLSVDEGAKTALRLALLPDDGPSGGFFHLDKELPW